MVRPKSLDQREFMSHVQKLVYKKKLKQLTDASKLPENFGELFLTEIKLSTDEANAHLRERAKMLGLWN